jgi:hypothetical protein
MSAARASSSAAIALLSQDGGVAEVLRSALQAFGASIVYEASLQGLDRGALKASGARIVVINLGDNEDALDDIQDLLESVDYEIVVNDSAVSAQLTGTDQARWVRHLTSKILHRPEIVLPPRPAGAEAPPTFEQHWAARVPVADVIGDTAAPVVAPPVAAAPVAMTSVEATQPHAVATPVVAPEIERPVSTEDAHLEHALSSIDTMSAEVPQQSEPEPDSLEDADFARALENFDAAAEAAASAEPHEGVADLEALLVAQHGREAIAPVDDLSVTEELPDLEFGSTVIASEVVVVDSRTASPPPKPAPATPAVSAPDWSLAPADESERLSLAEAAREFGIEKVPAEVYLTPKVDEQPTEVIDPKKVGAEIPRGFAGLDLELEPLEAEEDKKPRNAVAYDTGRDLELPTQVVKPPKREDEATKPKDS